MAPLLAHIRYVAGALVLVLFVTLAGAAGAQQTTPVNPTASSVKEDQLLRQLHRVEGRCTLPDQKACLIEQPQGRDWRRFHEITLRWIGAISVLGMIVLLVAFYLWRGMIRIERSEE